MKNIFLVTILSLLFPVIMQAQAKLPTIMVVPDDVWCYQNGYMTTYDNQGKEENVVDYESALQQNMELLSVVTKMGEIMVGQENFPLKDLASELEAIKRNEAEDAMTISKSSGSTLSESPYDKLINRAKADILVKIAWQINKVNGPKYSVTFNVKGIDAYSNKQVAAASGTVAETFSTEVPFLLEEAIVDKMDGFISQLQSHFLDIQENGREIVMNIRVFDNGEGISLEDEYDGVELIDVIDEWMAQNTVSHRYSLADATDNIMRFEQVRIPMYRENGMPMDTRRFVNGLRQYLGKSPYNLPAKIITKGLGRADLIIGEK